MARADRDLIPYCGGVTSPVLLGLPLYIDGYGVSLYVAALVHVFLFFDLSCKECLTYTQALVYNAASPCLLWLTVVPHLPSHLISMSGKPCHLSVYHILHLQYPPQHRTHSSTITSPNLQDTQENTWRKKQPTHSPPSPSRQCQTFNGICTFISISYFIIYSYANIHRHGPPSRLSAVAPHALYSASMSLLMASLCFHVLLYIARFQIATCVPICRF